MTAHSLPGDTASSLCGGATFDSGPSVYSGKKSRLKTRAEFVATSKGKRFNARCFTLQAAQRRMPIDTEIPRIGLTVTKKTGNSVVRNRIRRRLREALRLAKGLPASSSHDYVVVARRELLSANFAHIGAELASAFVKIHAPRPSRVARTS